MATLVAKPLQRRTGSRNRHEAGRCNLRPQSGQSLFELAIALPVLMLLALGVIEMGRYAYIGVLVGNAARAGAGYGAQSLPQSVDTNGITTAVQNDFQDNTQDKSNLSLSSINSSVSCGCDSGGTVATAGCTTAANPSAGVCAAGHWVVIVSVTATGTFNSLFNYPGIPTSITISKTSSMRVAQN
jgi:Flp pilus assembly protein TadG